jgi:2-oxoglutarate dehydrogenase E1 component
MRDFSFISNAHPEFVESLYQKYLNSPAELDPTWVDFFKGFDYAATNYNGNATTPTEKSGSQAPSNGQVKQAYIDGIGGKEYGVLSIIHGFRQRGHLLSDTNPIRARRDRGPRLDLADYNLEESDLDKVFTSGEEVGLKNATLRQILDHLRKIYAGHIGFEFAHIENREKRMWLREKIENRPASGYGFDVSKKKRILEQLNGAVGFEKFLHTKFIGQKRFSLEGGETTIAAIDAIINKGASDQVEEVVIGMAHRGRLNVLANVMKKTYEQIFNEFEGNYQPDLSFGDGDVKYHLGYSSQVDTPSGKNVHLKLVPNPSHLEAVDPVVLGFSRAKADILYSSDYDKILPILIHGDAAAAGQGIMFETVQMSQLKGYYVGGTIHYVINNQIGFTTDFDDARTSTYCTGVASVVQAPVFHVNGDDPEAVVWVAELATEFRQKFNTDVYIDMVCYRRHGHNEGDDPQFTQPEMYKFINVHQNPRELYVKQLAESGDIEKSLAESMEKAFWDDLQARLDSVKQQSLPYKYQEPERAWKSLKKGATTQDMLEAPDTGVDKKILEKIIHHLDTIPEGFKPINKVDRLLKGKEKQVEADQYDWQMGELMAYGSILLEGQDVRMSGQDVKRGTFSHRHAVFFDAETNREYNRLSSIASDQGQFRIFNSLLSEFAVLGFEYGYSLATPDALVIWEAQFGDFNNGAQTIIDQFITSGESKWQRMSGLVMLLPHGYEGQGPEHSSARLERFLQMGADNNIFVTNISTPANFFHALRRQLKFNFRKPLINMSPKSLLRHPDCVNTLEDFLPGKTFQEIIYDPTVTPDNAKKIKRILFCSGKVYYDLAEYKKTNLREDVAVVRIEQLYPFPETKVRDLLSTYKNAKPYWVQEEPGNMGAQMFINMYYGNIGFEYISRRPSSSPAVGYLKIHNKQQAELVEKAFS